ncbi:Asp23/Gls24 family envelope stress response protein [Pengzhenrongella frigida]|uniref:Asp23/Gls24 family envelope stress response protein n=1 Tax=Pengzhenrongella frigida TaxID=1259133 RepID=A0A4Q5MYG3_9MICO|nr:Asp23/Gls24 family envelope stress response protein [Cellulomonas sp. HLT2-17]
MASSTSPISWAGVAVAEDTQLTRAAPSERGDLEIAVRVVQKVARIAAGEVRGVASTGSGLDHLLGHQYPSADATVAGAHASIRVDVAVLWPYPLALIGAQVRDHVRARVNELVGLNVDAVDVTVSKVVLASQPETRRVQ